MKEVELEDISKRFGSRTLFSHLSYSFVSPNFYVILGPSGSGKSTLLEMIAGLDIHYTGQILLEGKSWKKLDEETRGNRRLTRIGYLRQGYDLLLLEKALENVILPLSSYSQEDSSLITKKGESLLSFMHLKKKAHEKVSFLSGGEKQRVALARSLSLNANIILADEPTGALDSKSADKIFSLLSSLSKNHLVIMVSHDEEKAREYGSIILKIEEGQLKEEKLIHRSSQLDGGISLKLTSHKRKPHVSPFFWLSHAFHLSKEKRGRSLLSISLLVCSLLGLGISSYLSRDVGKEIEDSFSSLIGGGKLIANLAGTSGNAISKAYPLEKEETASLTQQYPGLFSQYGVSYKADFPSFFPDENDVYVSSSSGPIFIDGLSASSPNEYRLLSEIKEPIYPSTNLLENDEVILSLPYASMASLCFQLHVPRDYVSLGSYLSFHPLPLVFALENEAWKYSDEQIFTWVGVSESSLPFIIHSSCFWSEHFYEERLRFPVSNGSNSSLPWLLTKLTFVIPSLPDESFLSSLRIAPLSSRYLFDKISSSYGLSFDGGENGCSLQRYYVYSVDGYSFAKTDISSLSTQVNRPFLVCGEDSYLNFPEALMSGFAHPFYASFSSSKIEEVISYWDSVPLDAASLSPTLPEGVVEGDYKKPAESELTLSNDYSSLLSGRKEKSLDEIVISSSLAKKWNNPKEIFIGAYASGEVKGDKYECLYRNILLKVVGVVDSETDKFFVPSFWSQDFFLLQVGMSAFSLSSTSLIFEIGESESKDLLARLGSSYPQYRFVDPSSSIKDSSQEVISFLELSLSLSSSSSLIVGFLVLLVTGLLLAHESKGEGRSLYLLGFSRKEISASYEAIVFLPTFISLLISEFSLFFCEYMVHKQIGENFETSSSFSLDYVPFLMVLLFACIAYLLLSLFLRSWVSRRSFSQER
jgi:ABC-type lipoprotein export system ATPase subunit